MLHPYIYKHLTMSSRAGVAGGWSGVAMPAENELLRQLLEDVRMVRDAERASREANEKAAKKRHQNEERASHAAGKCAWTAIAGARVLQPDRHVL